MRVSEEKWKDGER